MMSKNLTDPSPSRNIVPYDSLPKHPALLSKSLIIRDRPPTPKTEGLIKPLTAGGRVRTRLIRNEKPVKVPSLEPHSANHQYPLAFSSYPVLPPVKGSDKSFSVVSESSSRTETTASRSSDARHGLKHSNPDGLAGKISSKKSEREDKRKPPKKLKSLGGRNLGVYTLDPADAESANTKYVSLPEIQTSSGPRKN